jgi:hypothetical protein
MSFLTRLLDAERIATDLEVFWTDVQSEYQRLIVSVIYTDLFVAGILSLSLGIYSAEHGS